jgi:Phage integrase, N-terminal SAM-like domain/Phage integrase family
MTAYTVTHQQAVAVTRCNEMTRREKKQGESKGTTWLAYQMSDGATLDQGILSGAKGTRTEEQPAGENLTESAGSGYPTPSRPRGLTMKGTIRTLEKCPVCKGPFTQVLHPITKDDVIDLMCETCKTRPVYYYIDARDMQAGKIYKDAKGYKFDSFGVSHRMLEEMRAKIDDRTFDPNDWMPAKRREMRFNEMSRTWLSRLQRRVGYSHYRHSKTAMNVHILPVFKDYDVRDIRTSHIDDLFDRKSIKNYMGTLQEFMRYLFNREIIQRLPKFEKLEIPKAHRGWINAKQQKLVLSHIPAEHRLIFETLIETAERPGSVCAHMKRDLAEEGEIVIDKAFDEAGTLKEEKEGQVIYRAVSDELYKKLVRHSKNMLPNAWLFTQPDGRVYKTQKLYELWREASQAVGLDISLYPATRHSRASQKRLEMEKRVAESVRAELGHKSSKTTMRHYAKGRRDKI